MYCVSLSCVSVSSGKRVGLDSLHNKYTFSYLGEKVNTAMPTLDNKITVIQGNLHKSGDAMACLTQKISNLKMCIALLQEPHYSKGKVRGLSRENGEIFCAKMDGKVKARTCIFISKDVTKDAILLPQFSGKDITTVRVELKLKDRTQILILSSIYLPYDSVKSPPSQEMVELVEYCEKRDLDLVIGTDANSHNVIWGSSDTNQRGRDFLDYIATTKLWILNEGTEPTFVIKNRSEVIDLTLCSRNLLSYVDGWHVSPEITLSDHKRIVFSLNFDSIEEDIEVRNPRKTDWGKYDNLLYQKLEHLTFPPINSVEDIECRVASVTEAMLRSFKESCPLVSKSRRRNPWWTDNLERIKNTLRKMRRLIKKLVSPEASSVAFDIFKSCERIYRKEIKKAKNKSWRAFCDNISSLSEAARIKKIFASECPRFMSALKKSDGSFCDNVRESLECLVEAHFPGCTLGLSAPVGHSAVPVEEDWSVATGIITSSRLCRAMKTFKSFKSAGVDEIFPALFQHVLLSKDLLCKELKVIFQASIAFGYIPTIWRQARVIFIPKPGKPNYSEPRSFRPISLTSFLLKLLEKVCEIYLKEDVLTDKPMSVHQHAYCTGKSVESALHCVVGKIEKSLHFGELSLGAFLDIEGAFDRVSHSAIDKGLMNKGITGTVKVWLLELLKCRQVKVSSGGQSIFASVGRGCPQGGILSPLFWNLAVEELLESLNTKGFFTVGYADDIAIVLTGIDYSTICNRMQQAFKIVENWCKMSGLSVNPGKTNLILFTRKSSVKPKQLPVLYGQPVELTNQVKYLGVILDKKLLWNIHLEDKIGKTLRSFWQCRNIIGKSWGLSPKMTRFVYTQMVRPILTFASVIWWPRVKLRCSIDALNKLQRHACLAISGALRSTPSAALEMLLDISPLHIFIEIEAIKGALRLQKGNMWDLKGVIVGHSRILLDSSKRYPELTMLSDSTSPSEWHSNPNISLCIENDGTGYQECLQSISRCDVKVFTDGSSAGGKSGAGFVWADKDIEVSCPLGQFATAFIAEVYAIVSALSCLLEHRVINKDICIASDCKGALRAVCVGAADSLLVKEARTRLSKLSENNRIFLFWVPGHSDISGNEIADRLSRIGKNTPFIGPEPAVGISKETTASQVQIMFSDKIKDFRDGLEVCGSTWSLFSDTSSEISAQLLGHPRSVVRILIGFLTGHWLNAHLCKMGVSLSPICRWCSVASSKETVEHVLCVCPSLAAIRNRVFGDVNLDIRTLRLNEVNKLLAFWSSMEKQLRP